AELRERAADDWFAHDSLEALDHLRERREAELRELAGNLRAQAGKLAELADPEAAAAQRARVRGEFEALRRELENGALQPNEALREKLRQIDPKALASLPAEELQKMREELEKQARELNEAAGEGQEGEAGAEGEAGENGERRAGGPGGGEEGAPEFLGEEGAAIAPGMDEGLKRPEGAAPDLGDLLQRTEGEHEVNPENARLRDGGKNERAGSGGLRLWEESHLPAEQRALRGFFE
ncbi:MAG: hypothetical protein ACQKBY_04505, partial [Verrucomicrobiales bacterium]